MESASCAVQSNQSGVRLLYRQVTAVTSRKRLLTILRNEALNLNMSKQDYRLSDRFDPEDALPAEHRRLVKEACTPPTGPSAMEIYWQNRKVGSQQATEPNSSSSESSTPPWILDSCSWQTITAPLSDESDTVSGLLGSDSSGQLGKAYPENGSTAEILDAREARYGGFKNNSRVAQVIKSAMKQGNGWAKLLPTQQESLDQIASKISRIVSGGDTSYADSWRDISGYAELVVKELQATNTL